MNKIHFVNLSWNWWRISALIVASVCILLGHGLIFDYENGLITAFGFFIILVQLSQRFWYKNYVEYNQLGIVIKLNYLRSKSLKFREIEQIKIKEDRLTINIKDNKKLNFNLKSIQLSDRKTLISILAENSKAKFVDESV
jgi:hypothetical protein